MVLCYFYLMANPNLQASSFAGAPDKEFENSIRPSAIRDFSGQPQLIENLLIFIRAAKQRDEALDHILFHGPPGLGKTRLSRGTPRIANGLLRRVRDFAQVLGNGIIDMGITKHALRALNVDEHGLDEMDNRILSTIIEKFKGGPVGLNTISTAVGEESGTIEEVYEPFLIQEGFLMRTPRGREVTAKAYEHMGKKPGSAG